VLFKAELCLHSVAELTALLGVLDGRSPLGQVRLFPHDEIERIDMILVDVDASRLDVRRDSLRKDSVGFGYENNANSQVRTQIARLSHP